MGSWWGREMVKITRFLNVFKPHLKTYHRLDMLIEYCPRLEENIPKHCKLIFVFTGAWRPFKLGVFARFLTVCPKKGQSPTISTLIDFINLKVYPGQKVERNICFNAKNPFVTLPPPPKPNPGPLADICRRACFWPIIREYEIYRLTNHRSGPGEWN